MERGLMRIDLHYDTLTPDLFRKIRQVSRPRTIFEAGAKRVQVEISKHLKRLQARGNKMGWPSQGFFVGASDAVEKNVGITSIGDQHAIISISDYRFVHRVQGGVVRAKRRKFLAIPLNAEAYALQGKGSLKESAPDLVLRFPFLGYATKDGKFRAMFRLMREVTHKPHPEELPDAKKLEESGARAMTRAANLLLRAERNA